MTRTRRPTPASPLGRLAHVTTRFRWVVIALWLATTVFGTFAAGQLSTRWFQSTAVPGKPAYEGSQRALETFGAGVRAPNTVVFHSERGDVTERPEVREAMERVIEASPGALTSSFFTTGKDMYVSKNRHTTFLQVYPPGQNRLDARSGAKEMRAAATPGLPGDITVDVTGHGPVIEEGLEGTEAGSGVLVEALVAGFGALIILLFVFGTLPAVLMPLLVAVASVLNTFSLVWLLTYVTDVSIIVQFLIAIVGLGVAIDYSLLMIFRFRDELREGRDVETALVETMTHAGHAVIVSGTTVGVGLLAMVLLPLPLLRSVGIGGMLIPVVSVVATLTLLPAMLAVLGPRINSIRVMPRRLIDTGHPEDGTWGRWARFVLRRPRTIAAVGMAIVVVFAGYGMQLVPAEAELRYFPGQGSAIDGRDRLTEAGISHGVMKPLTVLVEDGGDATKVAETLAAVPGVRDATVPPGWQRGDTTLVEGFATTDGADPEIVDTIARAKAELDGSGAALIGTAAIDRDFIDALLESFPLALGLVLLVTLVLLTRAFRSIVMAIKAVVLNLLSLSAAFGIIVIIFQEGHGSSLWGLEASHSTIPYVPVMVFAFLFGLSMDYEVFMLSRMREAYDETGSTDKAIELGLARTGKLVTSAALVLMFAFLVLSTTPGYEVKAFAIGLAAGIIFDATVIRAMLVPALLKLFGNANWWMPSWMNRALRIPTPEPTPAEPPSLAPATPAA